jgi:crotonobetainyl-CoA:carnitine CoA-transferase CaiB-like acyl-CoA transferase
MQAFSGIMSITGEADGAPVRAGVSFIDLATGSLCAFGIVSALMSRAQTGRGQRVDGALLDTAIGMLNYHAQSYLLTGEVPRPMGSAHPAIAPYRNYRCADGHWVFVAGANDGLTRKLLGALLAGLRRPATRPMPNVRNRVELTDRREAIARHGRNCCGCSRKRAFFVARELGRRCAADPQTRARAVTGRWTIRCWGLSLSLECGNLLGHATAIRRHAPRWGEHTDATLAGLGHSPAAIAALRKRKVVK